jgi:hypothetical protein
MSNNASREVPSEDSYNFVVYRTDRDPGLEFGVAGYGEASTSRNIDWPGLGRRATMFVRTEPQRDYLKRIGWLEGTEAWKICRAPKASEAAPEASATSSAPAPVEVVSKAPEAVAGPAPTPPAPRATATASRATRR